MRSRQKGIGTLVILTIVAILSVIALSGYILFEHRQHSGVPQQTTVARERKRVERTVTAQIKPLASQLTSMGFERLADLKTDCSYYTVKQPDPNSLEDIWESPGEHFSCSSGIDRLIKVPADRVVFIRQSSELDKILLSNGWNLASDQSTAVWAEKVGKAQPQSDQSYTKTVDDLDCSLRLWSAFSNPDPPAVSVVIACGEYR